MSSNLDYCFIFDNHHHLIQMFNISDSCHVAAFLSAFKGVSVFLAAILCINIFSSVHCKTQVNLTINFTKNLNESLAPSPRRHPDTGLGQHQLSAVSRFACLYIQWVATVIVWPHWCGVHWTRSDWRGSWLCYPVTPWSPSVWHLHKSQYCSQCWPDPCATIMLTKLYLVSYNTAQFLGWSFLFYQMVSHLAGGGAVSELYAATATTLQIFQTGALLEILHAGLGLVRSSVQVTVQQVWSRWDPSLS